ncbi:hypothetical protein DV737_g4014, partial [Chaetothyriales sp. CBS 132003]
MPLSLFPRSRTVRVPVDDEQVAIRQVQVTSRARPVVGRFVITVVLTYCVANTLAALASDDVKKRPEQAARGQTEARRRRIQTPQDREWQDFKDLMLDETLVVEVQKKAAHVVLHVCHHRADLKPWLRWIEYTGRTGVRFDIAPQIFSPTVYEVPCVFVKPSQVELGWRALSPASGARIERIFHPVVFASAFYAGLHAFASKSLAITAARLNKALAAPGELLRVEKQQQKQAAGLMLPSHHTLSWKAHLARAQSMTYTEALTAARQVFKAVWMMKQSAAMQAHTPGLCMMKGVVTLEGRKGRVRLDVTAYYSPSTKSLVGLPLITSYLVIPDPETWDAAAAKQKAAAVSNPPGPARPLPSFPGKQSQATPNRAIIQGTACPYLLTVSHATATFLSTSILSPRPLSGPPRTCPPCTCPPRTCPRSPRAFRRRLHLALFSALFTANITLCNFSLGLVSLPVHQTIRAITPLLTIAMSIGLGLKTVSSYRAHTYLSLLPIVFGVGVASTSATGTAQPEAAAVLGVCMTLLGAVSAVLKTIAAHWLQADLGIQSYELIHVTAPLAAAQGLVAACFEANKRCGPLTMGVAANLKQIAVLVVPGGPPPRNVVVGSLATLLGGLWYAVAQARQ